MGTRHLTMVINKAGETKVAQYGQWDGYFEGQGATILGSLREFDLENFNDKLNKLTWLTKEQSDIVNATEDWAKAYPYLSRDCGGQILNAIYNGEVEVNDFPNPRKVVKVKEIIGLVDDTSFASDSLFCEYAYVVDLSKNTFEIYVGFNKEVLADTERFAKLEMEKDGDYKQVKLVKTYQLDKLPTEQEFLKDLVKEEEEA